MSDRDSLLAEQEVDDELRRERLNALWQAYGRYLIAGAVVIVLLVAGNEYFTYQKENAERRNSAILQDAIDKSVGENINLITYLTEALPKLEGGYNSIARLELAAAQLETRDFAGAVATYDALAANSSADPSLRNLAELLAAMVTASERGDLEGARTRFSGLAVEGGIWYYSALEQIAFIDLQLGDETSAIASLDTLISDLGTPATIRARAEQLRELIAPVPAVEAVPQLDEPTQDDTNPASEESN